MKKTVTLLWDVIKIVILSSICIAMLPILLIINIINGVSILTTLQSIWFAIQIGKEENEEEL